MKIGIGGPKKYSLVLTYIFSNILASCLYGLGLVNFYVAFISNLAHNFAIERKRRHVHNTQEQE